MKEKVKFYGSILIIVIFVPYLITVYARGGLPGLSLFSKQDTQWEEQVVSVLASEIPADAQMECLKAQAVIARTNLYQETIDSGWSKNQMQAAWGDHYEEYLERLQEAVRATSGEVLTYHKELIQAAYHVACNARTRNAWEVPGQEEYVYLTSVESGDDILADGFLYIGYMEKEDFAAAIQDIFPDESIDAATLPDALEIAERDQADYVTRVQYGSTVANGEALRAALQLKSACFYLSELDGKIRIVTKGIGHGLGFSQYGAQQMALAGAGYEELLHYYYTDIEIEKMDINE